MAHLEETHQKIEIEILKTTGGSFEVTVESNITVENLKKIVSKKLKISKDRICLMNSERELQDGTLTENGIVNGSRIIVTPNVETGLAQRNTENTVMQALESLNDNQVNDFLSGKSPLNLSVRLGDHLMMIQLQLSTLSPSQQNSIKQQKLLNEASSLKQAVGRSTANCRNFTSTEQSMSSHTGCKRVHGYGDEDSNAPERQKQKSDTSDETKSPIKSLSSMVSNSVSNSNPISTNTVVQNSMSHSFYKAPSPTVDPISANLTSCLCKRLNISCNNNCHEQRSMILNDVPCTSSSLTNSASSVPRIIPFHHRPSTSTTTSSPPQQSSLSSSNVVMKAAKQSQPLHQPMISQSQKSPNEALINTDNPALAEASRNLTQTLRKLSKRVFTSKAHIMENNVANRNVNSSSNISSSSSTSGTSSTFNSSGAVIESMKHHGKGIYSGTFSGTLNPALQDKNGRPKRDISTIIHILNDLLSATPQCAKNGTKIFFEPTQSISSGASSSSKFIKVKKQSNSKTSCMRCVPNVQHSHQKCAYGQCNGHLKTESATHSSSSHYIPSTSAGSSSVMNRNDDCIECNQTLINRKLELENMKTKSKLDQLKLVMQQKKERREARKLMIAPYNTPLNSLVGNVSAVQAATTVPVPLVSASNNSINGSSSNMNRCASDAQASSSTSIATSISSENHMEEVETVA